MNDKKTPLYAIVAMTKNRAIGKHNQLLWHLPDDLKRVKALTTEHVVIMGRKTYAAIGKPLPNRINIVISRSKSVPAEGVQVVASLAQAFTLAQTYSKKIFIFGGAEIYRQALPFITDIYLTLIDAELDGDAYFPELDMKDWRIVHEESHPKDAKHAYAFKFLELVKK